MIYTATRGGGAWVAAWSLNSPGTPALLQRFDMTNGPGIAGASAVVSADLAGEVYVVMAGQGSGTLAVFRAGTARWPWIWRWGRTSPRGRSRGF